MRFWADQQEGVMLAVAKFQTDIRVRQHTLHCMFVRPHIVSVWCLTRSLVTCRARRTGS